MGIFTLYKLYISNLDHLQRASGYKAYIPLDTEAEHPRFSTNPGHLSFVLKAGNEDTPPPQNNFKTFDSPHTTPVVY